MSMVATAAFSVTPSDSADLSTPARAFWVGNTGNVALVVNRGGASVTFLNVPSGSVLPVQAYRVMSTGTTATNIIALL